MNSVIPSNGLVHVATSPIFTSTKKCIFINNKDGSMEGHDQTGCQEGNGQPSFFVCRKEASCGKTD